MKSFGLGQFLGYDLPPGRKGHIPSSKFYDHYYPNGGWRSSTIISNSIGQGEVLMTPIQLANMMAIVANKGWYYTPHVIKKIKNHKIDSKYTTKHTTSVESRHFEPVIDGLFDVYNLGTAAGLGVQGLEICGKTGTAQNPQGEDHSIFIAFAPLDKPKIAIAVFIENAGFGGTWAAPTASLMMEKYMKGKITDKEKETRILTANLLNVKAKPKEK